MQRVRSAAIRIAACCREDPVLFGRALLWRLVLPPLKYMTPLPVLVRFMSLTPRPGSLHTTRVQRLRAIRSLLDGGRVVISANCLERSLVLFRFLSEVGAAPELVMGVSRTSARVAGHTWIEVEGHVLADATTEAFAPMLIFGPEGQARPSA
jgi:hypothetical protein